MNKEEIKAAVREALVEDREALAAEKKEKDRVRGVALKKLVLEREEMGLLA